MMQDMIFTANGECLAFVDCHVLGDCYSVKDWSEKKKKIWQADKLSFYLLWSLARAGNVGNREGGCVRSEDAVLRYYLQARQVIISAVAESD